MGRRKTFKGYMKDIQKMSNAFKDKSTKHYSLGKSDPLKIYEYNREMSPYQFEEFMADLFRKLGYKKVKVTNFSRDKGKDIIMEQDDKDRKLLVIVECKFQKALVGRPVIQKLHSALSMHRYSGSKKGIVITTGEFSKEAKEYAEEIYKRDKNIINIELINRKKLNQLIKKVGSGIFKDKGAIKINVSYPHSNKEQILDLLNKDYFKKIKNLKRDLVKINSIILNFEPSFFLEYEIKKSFKTSIGPIYKIDKQDFMFINCQNGNRLSEDIIDILGGDLREINKLDGVRINIEKPKLSELRLKTICLNKVISNNSKKVGYYGKNNVYYEKNCEVERKDIDILGMNSANIPKWEIRFSIGKKGYLISFVEGLKEIFEINNTLSKCFICGNSRRNLFYCEFCKKIFCNSHIHLCKNCGKPICKNCSVDKRKFLLFNFHFCSEKCLEKYENRKKDFNGFA